jgi:YVTN family beta-propeller protein
MLSSLSVCLCLFIVVIISLSPGLSQVFGDSVTSVIPVDSFPQALVFNPSNNNIYAANRDSGTVSVIETDNNVMSVTNTDNMILFFDLQNRIWNFQLFVTLDISIVHIKP